MPLSTLRLGYLPLLDAAPLIIAHELDFATEEGLQFELLQLGAWAQARDMLSTGNIDAAHMLVPMPVAQAIGLAPAIDDLDLVMFLSHGGQAIAVNQTLSRRLRDIGHDFDFHDARKAAEALDQALQGTLRIGVPFHFSTQLELVHHWLGSCGFRHPLQTVTVPPSMMAAAMAADEIDAFCVGEPWASSAVERGLATLLLPGVAIWASPPEKGLVMQRRYTVNRPDMTGALMRVLWRAAKWLDQPENRSTSAEILARRQYLNLSSELTERALAGQMVITPEGDTRAVADFIAFHDGGASFPWRSLAAWFAQRLARRYGLDEQQAMQRAMAHFRTDLYRQHLQAAGAALPGASSRLEGALSEALEVGAARGQMLLRADSFFDGFVFDPPPRY